MVADSTLQKNFSIFLSPAGMSLTKLSLGGNILYMTSLFPPRESLVSGIPAGNGDIEKLFYSVPRPRTLTDSKGFCEHSRLEKGIFGKRLGFIREIYSRLGRV